MTRYDSTALADVPVRPMWRGNVDRLRELARDASVDAVFAFTVDNLRWATGFRPAGQVLKTGGAYSGLIPTDASVPMALIVSEFDEMWAREQSGLDDVRALRLWVEIDDRQTLEQGQTASRSRPVQFDWAQVFDYIEAILRERRLDGARIACEVGALSAAFQAKLMEIAPKVEWVDASELFWRAAMIKTPEEVRILRESVRLTEIGLRAALLDSDPRGKTVSQLRLRFDDAVRLAVADLPDLGGYQSTRVYMTTDSPIGPNVGRNPSVVRDGSLIWVDCGVTIDGYESDIGRTFQVGRANPLTERIAGALEAGGEAGFAMLRAGALHSELYEVTQKAVRSNGLPTYTRGHFGHAIGAGGGELHPFVEPLEQLAFEPGMVIAYERPYYVRGLGGFQFEDDIFFSESGVEILTRLPRQMFRI